MTGKDVIRNTMEMSHQVLQAYLSDLTDADLLVRSVPEANHIAWQLGHMIASEQHMMSEAGYAAPELPAGFSDRHTKETSRDDDRARFLPREEYLALLEEQRNATLAALDAAPEGDLDKPAPESMRHYVPTHGAIFNLIGLHEMMHAAQFVPVRRKLGKPVLI